MRTFELEGLRGALGAVAGQYHDQDEFDRVARYVVNGGNICYKL